MKTMKIANNLQREKLSDLLNDFFNESRGKHIGSILTDSLTRFDILSHKKAKKLRKLLNMAEEGIFGKIADYDKEIFENAKKTK